MNREQDLTPDPKLVLAREKRKAEAAAKAKAAAEATKAFQDQAAMKAATQGVVLPNPAADELQATQTIKVPPEVAVRMVNDHAEACFNDLVGVVNKFGSQHPGTMLAVSMLEMEIRRLKYATLDRG